MYAYVVYSLNIVCMFVQGGTAEKQLADTMLSPCLNSLKINNHFTINCTCSM